MFTLQLHSFQTAGHQSKLMLCWAISREKNKQGDWAYTFLKPPGIFGLFIYFNNNTWKFQTDKAFLKKLFETALQSLRIFKSKMKRPLKWKFHDLFVFTPRKFHVVFIPGKYAYFFNYSWGNSISSPQPPILHLFFSQ